VRVGLLEASLTDIIKFFDPKSLGLLLRDGVPRQFQRGQYYAIVTIVLVLVCHMSRPGRSGN